MLSVIDEMPLLQQRALAARINTLVVQKGLSLRDAFDLFDHDSDNVISPSELYGGVTWLGLDLTPKQASQPAVSGGGGIRAGGVE